MRSASQLHIVRSELLDPLLADEMQTGAQHACTCVNTGLNPPTPPTPLSLSLISSRWPAVRVQGGDRRQPRADLR